MIEHEKYKFNHRVIMKSENNQIITTVSFEVYHLVKTGDVINAKVKPVDYGFTDCNYYELSDIEFVHHGGK